MRVRSFCTVSSAICRWTFSISARLRVITSGCERSSWGMNLNTLSGAEDQNQALRRA